MPPDMQSRCGRCSVEGPFPNGAVCELCRTDLDVLGAVSDWCGSQEAREVLQWEGGSLAAALEYEIFMLAMQKLGESHRPGDGNGGA